MLAIPTRFHQHASTMKRSPRRERGSSGKCMLVLGEGGRDLFHAGGAYITKFM